ncbi:MAG: cell division protein ZapD [Gammaproteobacteria bacterium]
MMKETIIYEQPLNEIIRVCLRLEQLFLQVDHQLNDLSDLGTRNLVTFIINILQILDRPDLKAKLAREISHHMTNLRRYGNAPDIDAQKLDALTTQLDMLSSTLIESSGKIGHRLRDIELLNTLRMHLASPGGGCSFDIPMFHYWLHQPSDIRKTSILDWLNDFNEVREGVTLVLQIVRNNGKVQEKTAIHGFYQELLDPQSNLRMIRISIAADSPAFPETSVGRHFLSVRFFTPNIFQRAEQFTGNLPFLITYS